MYHKIDKHTEAHMSSWKDEKTDEFTNEWADG